MAFAGGILATNMSLDPKEAAKFAALARRWWNTSCPSMRGLHAFNAVRVPMVRRAAAAAFPKHDALPTSALRPLSGTRILDVGCGGGLLSLPLARLGASVTSLDVTEDNVGAVRAAAATDPGLQIEAICSTVEDLAGDWAKGNAAGFDVVVSSEVLEHVVDRQGFLEAASQLVRPGGALALTTLNRTAASYGKAIWAAEQLLGVVPDHTHDWDRFVKPSELADSVKELGFRVVEVTGFGFHPVGERWEETDDLSVNYGMVAVDVQDR